MVCMSTMMTPGTVNESNLPTSSLKQASTVAAISLSVHMIRSRGIVGVRRMKIVIMIRELLLVLSHFVRLEILDLLRPNQWCTKPKGENTQRDDTDTRHAAYRKEQLETAHEDFRPWDLETRNPCVAVFTGSGLGLVLWKPVFSPMSRAEVMKSPRHQNREVDLGRTSTVSWAYSWHTKTRLNFPSSRTFTRHCPDSRKQNSTKGVLPQIELFKPQS